MPWHFKGCVSTGCLYLVFMSQNVASLTLFSLTHAQTHLTLEKHLPGSFEEGVCQTVCSLPPCYQAVLSPTALFTHILLYFLKRRGKFGTFYQE